jgi:hypothetical protein
VNGHSDRLVKVIPDICGPIAVDTLSNRLWAVNALPGPRIQLGPTVTETVSLIDIRRNEVVSTLSLGSYFLQGDLFKIVVDPVTNEAFTLTHYLGMIDVLSGREHEQDVPHNTYFDRAQ